MHIYVNTHTYNNIDTMDRANMKKRVVGKRRWTVAMGTIDIAHWLYTELVIDQSFIEIGKECNAKCAKTRNNALGTYFTYTHTQRLTQGRP